MAPRIHHILAASAIAWGLSLASLPAAAQAATPAVQATTAQGVTVKVTPPDFAATDTWAFKVVLDTHTQALSDDLLQSVVLVTEDGREIKPAGWKGAAPGGHHREGMLEFAVPDPAPKVVELRMQRPGEAAVRSFRWAR